MWWRISFSLSTAKGLIQDETNGQKCNSLKDSPWLRLLRHPLERLPGDRVPQDRPCCRAFVEKSHRSLPAPLLCWLSSFYGAGWASLHGVWLEINCFVIKKFELKCQLLRRIQENPGAYHLEILTVSPTGNMRPLSLSEATQKDHPRSHIRVILTTSLHHANKIILFSPGWENHWRFPNRWQIRSVFQRMTSNNVRDEFG